MDPVWLARLQFALTISFHFIFPPITIGMAWLISWIMWRAHRTRDVVYTEMGQFWIRIFAVNFAIGVATGITMEFQFGTNWAAYSRYVGDIFGAPLAAEGIFAFFLESTFLGILLFGGSKISSRLRFVAALMVALGSTLSAFWIIVANSWQQTPAGYELVDGRAQLVDFGAAVFNPSTIPRYVHSVNAALTTGAFFVLGIAAWYLLRRRHLQIARRSAKIALVLAFVSSLAQLYIGDMHAVQVARTQPVKLAAFEAHFQTQSNAPMLLFGVPNLEEGRADYAIEIPGALSLMVGRSTDTEVPGLLSFPRDEWPPVRVLAPAFHIMVLLGLWFLALSAVGLLLIWRKKLFSESFVLAKWYLRAAIVTAPLPVLANELGWFSAEVGRQPWVVWHLLRTRDAVSVTVPAEHILASIIMFCLIYALLFALWVFLLRRKIIAGPAAVGDEEAS